MSQYLQKNLAADFDNIRFLYVPIFPKNADLFYKQILELYYMSQYLQKILAAFF